MIGSPGVVRPGGGATLEMGRVCSIDDLMRKISPGKRVCPCGERGESGTKKVDRV